MFEKLNELSFVIGVFFIIISLILMAGYFLSPTLHYEINLYTAIGMMVFGIVMVKIKG
ncbi:MAG: hypothetical protein ACK5BK_03765 [Bacteroidota bacterium]|jgi:hypothetical protein